MGWLLDLKVLKGGFYLTLFSIFGIGLRYKDNSLMFILGIYRLNIYFTLAIEE
jgi:hypothetical protein